MKTKLLILSLFLVSISSCYIPKQKPDNFDEFWQSSIKELGKEVNSSIIKDSIIGEKRITLRSIESYENTTIYAWVAEPLNSGKYPVFIRFSGFGRGNKSKNSIPDKWFLNQKNQISIKVDIRGQGLSTKQIKFKGYLTNGLENKDKYIYKGAFLDAVKAVDFAKTIPNRDGNIVVTGGSQGGALAVAASALNSNVTMCIANFPFLTDIFNYDKTKWPMKIWIHETKIKERKLEELHETLSYFDALNFADKIDVPVFLRTQEIDTITPKEGAIKLFKTIRSNNKNLYIAPCSGHGCSSKSVLANKMEQVFINENLIKNQ
ncbi:acetylxylan esterase [Winogradskyella flava]|uniref:Acetylxylan esterase n=1 Tax=Winogradskyella flava TaxID=1884876 RepID=A0A842IKP5_9FLAO|nr:acetylxylan esterase [Winogradskyella flava]MBC2843852.1 acetylxylan esterase [Winogradskyella flava]